MAVGIERIVGGGLDYPHNRAQLFVDVNLDLDRGVADAWRESAQVDRL